MPSVIPSDYGRLSPHSLASNIQSWRPQSFAVSGFSSTRPELNPATLVRAFAVRACCGKIFWATHCLKRCYCYS